MPIFINVLGLLLIAASTALAQEPVCAGHLVTIAPGGAVERGTKEALRDAVNRGAPIRVRWGIDGNADGVADVTHWADAAFLTEWRGEIFAQIADIQRQIPRTDPARIELPAVEQRWTGLLGTTGTLVGHFTDGTAVPEVRVSSTWCLAACPPPTWRVLYHHDADGRRLEGGKDALFDTIRRGYPIRLAWGASVVDGSVATSVEHATEPVFVTIMNGSELFVQVPEHIAQTSYSDPGNATFDNAPVMMWRGLLGTNGSFDAVYVERATGKEVRRLPQRARIAWFGFVPDPACAAPPLTLAVPGGVRRVPD